MQNQSGFATTLIKHGEEAGKPASHYDIGCYCEITDFDKRDNGLLGITVIARHRVQITDSRINKDGLVIGDIENLEYIRGKDTIPDQTLVNLVSELQTNLGPPYTELTMQSKNNFWYCQRLLEWLPIDLDVKYYHLSTYNEDKLVADAMKIVK